MLTSQHVTWAIPQQFAAMLHFPCQHLVLNSYVKHYNCLRNILHNKHFHNYTSFSYLQNLSNFNKNFQPSNWTPSIPTRTEPN
jgi:hypothetical protein